MAQINLLIGTITEVVDKDLYQIVVEIPEQNVELQAFPKRGELDEPRVGDAVVLYEVDPVYHSYYLYEKLKENTFIGIRSRGKLVKMTEDEILIGIYDPEDDDWYDANDGGDQTPEPTSWVKMNKDGQIELDLEDTITTTIHGDTTIKLEGKLSIEADDDSEITISGKSKVEIKSDSEVKISGDSKISVTGDAEISANGKVNISASQDVEVSGNSKAVLKGAQLEINGTQSKITGGMLEVSGSAPPTGSGPFCGIPVCPFTGAPHVGDKVMGT